MKYFSKKTIPENMLGLDSIQGYLELALYYNEEETLTVVLGCNKSNKDHTWSLSYNINQLEKEGYVNVIWEEDEENKDYITLKTYTLTVSGHKLLDELKNKNLKTKLKTRLSNLIWTVITSAFVTYVILEIKGI